jgi:hypothetical protein
MTIHNEIALVIVAATMVLTGVFASAIPAADFTNPMILPIAFVIILILAGFSVNFVKFFLFLKAVHKISTVVSLVVVIGLSLARFWVVHFTELGHSKEYEWIVPAVTIQLSSWLTIVDMAFVEAFMQYDHVRYSRSHYDSVLSSAVSIFNVTHTNTQTPPVRHWGYPAIMAILGFWSARVWAWMYDTDGTDVSIMPSGPGAIVFIPTMVSTGSYYFADVVRTITEYYQEKPELKKHFIALYNVPVQNWILLLLLGWCYTLDISYAVALTIVVRELSDGNRLELAFQVLPTKTKTGG